MKNIVILFISVVHTIATISAQNLTTSRITSDEVARIVLNIYVSDNFDIVPDYAQLHLKNKLAEIVTKNSMSVGGNDLNGRFFLTAKLVFLNKEVVPSSPAMYAMNIDLVLYVVDAVEKTIFETYTLPIKGAGNTEIKAFMQAIKSVNAENQGLQQFLNKGKEKIIHFYNANCDMLIQNAKSLAIRSEFGQAFSILANIPSACSECSDRGLALAQEIFQEYIEFDCQLKLNEARNIWNASLTRESAEKAGEILSRINPIAICYNDVKILSEEIKSHLKLIDGREWDLQVKKEYELEKLTLESIRDIGIAWGNGQPENVTVINTFRNWPW